MFGESNSCTFLVICVCDNDSLYSNRIPEAALMARSYLPSKVSEIVALWRKDLSKVIFLKKLYC